jgi:hypothetical protein
MELEYLPGGHPHSQNIINSNFETIQNLANKEGHVLYNGNTPMGPSINFGFPSGMTLSSLKFGIFIEFDNVSTDGVFVGRSIVHFWPKVMGTTTLATFHLFDNSNAPALKFVRISETNIQGHTENDKGNRIQIRVRKIILW